MKRRKRARLKMVVPVRVFPEGNEPVEVLAHTLDANDYGARLGGVHAPLTQGQIVVVQYQHRRARFRVKWCGTRGSSTSTQIGIECLEVSKQVWGIDFPEDNPRTVLGALKLALDTGY